MNVVYVGLTFKMLSATRPDSLREHRLRHLDDIKAAVLRPLLAWLSLTTLTGSLEGNWNVVHQIKLSFAPPPTKIAPALKEIINH